MSFVDLATLTMYRRNELEARINQFYQKCDRAIDEINKLKMKAKGFTMQLNCEQSELKEQFLSCTKRLDEYTYLITDFNIAMSKVDEPPSTEEYTPVHDTSLIHPMLPMLPSFNLMDALSEPAPSTSSACPKNCPPEKPQRVKVPKNQALIVFSSSSSEETVPQVEGKVAVEVQCDLSKEMSGVKITEPPSPLSCDSSNLPAQSIVDIDQVYEGIIMHIDGSFLWIIIEHMDEVRGLMRDMTEFYSENHIPMQEAEVSKLTYCAFYDAESDCYYRGLFIKLNPDEGAAEIFALDTGEIRLAPVNCVQPLYQQFCTRAPYARNCQLAGVDFMNHRNNSLMNKQEDFMKDYLGSVCAIKIDDNTSESLGVYVTLPSGETINNLLVEQGLALPIDKPVLPSVVVPPEEVDIDISDCPEYEDPVEAVTGYSNRDEADICKHYKGTPDKKCFKGDRCKKKHIMKHPDGWTLDKVEVIGKLTPAPLPEPGTWHKVLVTAVAHYDRVYVQLQNDNEQEVLPPFGMILPPANLAALERDMNSPATRVAYKPLKLAPALGELVAALYPPDNNWYRAEVLSITRADQCVELKYIDYGTVTWVREDSLRALPARLCALPAQALRCALAGLRAATRRSDHWARLKQVLAGLVQDRTLSVHVVAREYDEVVVEMFDAQGNNIAERLAAITTLAQIEEYSLVNDSDVTHQVVVP